MSASVPERGARIVPHPAGHAGTLRMSSGDELPVRTFDGGPEVVLVVLTEHDEHTGERPDPATLEYTSQRGVIRMQGEAAFTDRTLVRFHAAGEPEVDQRRAFVRVHASRELTLGPSLAAGSAPAYTLDVSGGGMLLFGADHLELDDTLSFEMDVDETEAPIAGIARVVRVDADGRRALHFERIAEADRERLIRFVFACLRTARAKTRGDLV